tara:strand:- start:1654 stop:2046 length:393 start_codon:yes stop_codon:yes gene_type:complete
MSQSIETNQSTETATIHQGIINKDLFNTTKYEKHVMDHRDIYIKIKDILGKNIYGYSLEELSAILEVDPIMLNQTLSIWHVHYCSYCANYGRVFYSKIFDKWYYMYTNNPHINMTHLSIEHIIPMSIHYQ